MSGLRREAVRVMVPASSANLGPAFDTAGLALAIYDDLIAMVTDDEGVLVEVDGEGEGVVPLDETNLVARSMMAAFARMDVRVPGFILRCVNVIPHGRGLGSSAAAIIGGIVLARAMVVDGRERMTDSDVLQLALAPGVRIQTTSRRRSTADSRWPGSRATASPTPCAWNRTPTFSRSCWFRRTRSPTSQARALLPDTVAFADASANVARAALLVHAMTIDPRRLMSATEDRLHQQRRAAAYPDSVALVARLRTAGVPAVISGAGPTVLAFPSPGTAAIVADSAGEGWIVQAVPVAPVGAREVPMPLLT